MISMGRIGPSQEQIRRGLRWLGEAAECIGSQLAMNDPGLALRATLLLSWLQNNHSDEMKEEPFLQRRGSGHLYYDVGRWLNEAHGDHRSTLVGLDEIEKHIEDDELVENYMRRARADTRRSDAGGDQAESADQAEL
jgi:hypothetical protein